MKRDKSKNKSPKRKTLRRLIEIGVLVALFVVLCLLKNSQKVSEFFAETFSRWWITAFGTLLGWIPFSLYEMFLIAVIVGAIAFLVIEIVLLCKHKWQKALTSVLVVVICVFAFLNIYTATASFAYNRDPLPTDIYEEYSGDDLTLEEAIKIADYVIEQANQAYRDTDHIDGNIVYPYDLAEMSDRLAKEYEKLDNKYFSSYTPRGKRILNKRIMSELHITGVFFAPFGEANINGNETGLYLPHTLGHEMAHGKGVMREYEADLVSSYVLLTSQDKYLRYGALVQCVTPAINMVGLYPNTNQITNELYAKLDSGIRTELSNYSKLWSQFDALDRLGNFFNDLYLKLNKQEDGVGSYNKPGEIVDTGEKDNEGSPIVTVIRFYDMQNILIKLYKQGKLVSVD